MFVSSNVQYKWTHPAHQRLKKSSVRSNLALYLPVMPPEHHENNVNATTLPTIHTTSPFPVSNAVPFSARTAHAYGWIDAIHCAPLSTTTSSWRPRAWVMMPEHVHLLIHPRRNPYSISAILKSIKQPVTTAAIKHIQVHAPEFLNQMNDHQPNGKSSHRFWQRGGGYDTNLWTPRHVAEKIEYIHNNPVRRGLVAHRTDWEWSSAKDYENLRPTPLLPLHLTSRPW